MNQLLFVPYALAELLVEVKIYESALALETVVIRKEEKPRELKFVPNPLG